MCIRDILCSLPPPLCRSGVSYTCIVILPILHWRRDPRACGTLGRLSQKGCIHEYLSLQCSLSLLSGLPPSLHPGMITRKFVFLQLIRNTSLPVSQSLQISQQVWIAFRHHRKAPDLVVFVPFFFVQSSQIVICQIPPLRSAIQILCH